MPKSSDLVYIGEGSELITWYWNKEEECFVGYYNTHDIRNEEHIAGYYDDLKDIEKDYELPLEVRAIIMHREKASAEK